MRKVYNFGAGPAMLPEEVLNIAQAELLDWQNTGMSIMELGHRGPEFKIIAEQSEANLRELMNIPSNYHVLFLSGGATTQFTMIPINLFAKNNSADYVDTGIWSKKAIAEAKRYGTVNIAASLIEKNSLIQIPAQENWHLNDDAAYVHYTPNETIEGVEFHWVPETGAIPLVADMSSMILSCPIDVSKFGIIYAGAQKNIGQAGISIVIIREDLLNDPLPFCPTLYNYKINAENKSFYNTPPTFAWYIAGLVLSWLKKMGGVQKIYEINRRKADKLYTIIDNNKDFYINNIHPNNRSIMNVPFNLKTPELNQLFLDQAKNWGLMNLKGHRLSGGIRASIYNAMPEDGVNKLVEFMQDFLNKFG